MKFSLLEIMFLILFVVKIVNLANIGWFAVFSPMIIEVIILFLAKYKNKGS